MARWKKNEATAALRRVLLAVYDTDGELAVVTTTFAAAGELMVDPSTGAFQTAGGTLANATTPLVVADVVFTTTHATETVNITAHGLLTGDGPVRLTTTTTLPAGYASGTDYYVIRTGTGTLQLALTLADAIAGTAVTISSDGTGTHTLHDASETFRLVPGHWIYTASQAEINISGAYFAVKLDKTGHRVTTVSVDLYEREMDQLLVAGVQRSDAERLAMAVLAGPVGDFTTGTLEFRCPVTNTIRLTVTTDSTGRLTSTLGTLT